MNSMSKKIALAKDLLDLLKKNPLSYYWQGFTMVPFALYDCEEIVLCNIDPLDFSFTYVDGLYVGKWWDKFLGNTAIDFNGEYIAIWNLEDCEGISLELSSLYSCLSHEMFHCYQLKNNWTLWADEFLAVTYPYSQDSLAIRLMEMDILLEALKEDDPCKKNGLISKFIFIREERKKLIGKYLDYELALESCEGTATYVQFKALSKIENLSTLDHISSFIGHFNFHDLACFRSSCYGFGLVMALLLDQCYPSWHKEFTSSKLFLYDFFKSKTSFSLDHNNLIIDNIYKENAKQLLNTYLKKNKNIITNFFNKDLYKIIVKGNLRISGFDPMNIVTYDKYVLHKNFLKVNDWTILSEILTIPNEDFWTMNEIEFYSVDKPQILDKNTIWVNDIKFQGAVSIEGTTYLVKV